MYWQIAKYDMFLYSTSGNKLARIIEARTKLYVFITEEKQPFYSQFYSSLEECMKDCKMYCEVYFRGLR